MSASAARSRPCRALAGALGGALILALPGVAASRTIAPSVVAQAAPAPGAGQPQPEPKPAEAVQPKPAPSAEPVLSGNAASVLGKKVVGPKGETLGLIVDVLVDSSGQPQAAVIDFGGFLGVGSRKIAIDWRILDFSQLGHSGTVELGLGRAQIAAAPEYKPGKPAPAVMTTPPAPDATQKNP